MQPKVTATRKRAGTKKAKPKSAADSKATAGKTKKKAAVSVKPSTLELMVPTQSLTSPLEDISDLYDRLHIQACVGLTRRLLTSISSLPQRQPACELFLRSSSYSWQNIAACPRRTVRFKALCLACRNADRVHIEKLELEHFLSQQGVDICLLSETFLKSHQEFRVANYVCYRTDRPTAG